MNRRVCTPGLYTSSPAQGIPHADGSEHLPHEHAGASGRDARRTRPRTSAGPTNTEPENPRLLPLAHLFDTQGAAPLPGPGAVALSRSLGVAAELDLDAPASCPGGTAPDPGLPPRLDAAPDDSAMLARLDATRKAAVAWLRRTGQ